jgi:Lon protease-like protein
VIEIPTEVPVMALANAVLFPHSLLPLHIFERRYRDMLADSLDGDRMFSVALMKKGIEEAVEIEDLCPVAGVGLIRACVGNENGTSKGWRVSALSAGRRKSRSERRKLK